MAKAREIQKIGDGLWVYFDGTKLHLERATLGRLIRRDRISLGLADFTAFLNYVENLNAKECEEYAEVKRRIGNLREA